MCIRDSLKAAPRALARSIDRSRRAKASSCEPRRAAIAVDSWPGGTTTGIFLIMVRLIDARFTLCLPFRSAQPVSYTHLVDIPLGVLVAVTGVAGSVSYPHLDVYKRQPWGVLSRRKVR